MTDIEIENKKKYLAPPTQKQIDSFVVLCRVSELHFEMFFGLPRGTIKVARTGYMPMPLKYWHIFYERTIPTYGVNAKKEPIQASAPRVRDVVRVEKVQEKIITPPVIIHGRFAALK